MYPSTGSYAVGRGVKHDARGHVAARWDVVSPEGDVVCEAKTKQAALAMVKRLNRNEGSN